MSIIAKLLIIKENEVFIVITSLFICTIQVICLIASIISVERALKRNFDEYVNSKK